MAALHSVSTSAFWMTMYLKIWRDLCLDLPQAIVEILLVLLQFLSASLIIMVQGFVI